MADLEKLYEMTVENNTNIKYIMRNQEIIRQDVDSNRSRLSNVENKGKDTAKEHLISFSKVCAAFLVIGSLFTFIVKLSGKIWQ